jgi:L-amino acid N-acyltransferase YncA
LAELAKVRIRPADTFDLPKITEIYNFEVVHGTATFDTEQKTLAEQTKWFDEHQAKNLPVLVAEIDGHVVAWAALSAWSQRCAYAKTVEISIYVADGYRQKGIGKQMLKELLLAGKAGGYHAVLARITQDNVISIKMHEKLGFFQAGHLREVGEKFGRRLDVYILQFFL